MMVVPMVVLSAMLRVGQLVVVMVFLMVVVMV